MGVDRKSRNGEYRIHENIGNCDFGEEYRVTNRDGTDYAAKFAKRKDKSCLEKEWQLMKLMGSHNQETAYNYFYGRHGNRCVLLMDLLEKSILDLHKTYRGLSLKTVIMLGIQMTRRVKALHDSRYIHRDIKPENFMVGRRASDSNYVFLIDYGLAQRYMDSSNRHISKSSGQGFSGTWSFASRYARRGERQSRRSDLESVVYTLIYLFIGELLWEHQSSSETTKMKEAISSAELCRDVRVGLPCIIVLLDA